MVRRMLNKLAGLFLFFVFIAFSALAQESGALAEQEKEVEKGDASRFFTTAVVQGLNKVTAKTVILDLKIGQEARLGTMTIIAHKCWQSPPEQKPESKILLEIFEDQSNEAAKGKKRIFYGWMFASSPSISGLEHPIYDFTALNCKK